MDARFCLCSALLIVFTACQSGKSVVAKNGATSDTLASDTRPTIAPSTKRLEKLGKDKSLLGRKILRDSETDIAAVKQSGAVVTTVEPDYLVVTGTQENMNQLEAMGYELLPATSKDHKLRIVRIRVNDDKERSTVVRNFSDVWQANKTPSFICGARQ